jgi:hypothetical protein
MDEVTSPAETTTMIQLEAIVLSGSNPKIKRGNATETVRRLALAVIDIYGGVGPEHSFGTTDLNWQLRNRGIAVHVGLPGDRSVCGAVQRTCLASRQRKSHLPVAFERQGTRWWISREYAAEYLRYAPAEEICDA